MNFVKIDTDGEGALSAITTINIKAAIPARFIA